MMFVIVIVIVDCLLFIVIKDEQAFGYERRALLDMERVS